MPTVRIEKLVFGGQGLARVSAQKASVPDKSGQVVFVWNALPGEEVEIEYLSNKKDYAEAVATRVIISSPDRIQPREGHFLSSSPWQMMTWEAENSWKQKIAAETYGRQGGLILDPGEPAIEFDSAGQYGYRNKLEYSFTALADGTISLAFFERGQKQRTPVTESLLAEPVINEVSAAILAWINRQQIPLRSLKSLIVRSNHRGQAIAALFIKDQLVFPDYPAPNEKLVGFQLYYSTHKSPASVPTKILQSAGENHLVTELLGTKLKFGLTSFFQVNIPVFENALRDMAAFIGPHEPLIDYYSGVGAISLPLARNRADTKLIDNNEEAIQYAKENITLNRLPHCQARCLPAEKIPELISSDGVVVLDRPRASSRGSRPRPTRPCAGWRRCGRRVWCTCRVI